MAKHDSTSRLGKRLQGLLESSFSPLDLLPHDELIEKMIDLDLSGVPDGPAPVTAPLADLAVRLANVDTSGLEVVVFGGGTGLSNVVGGDSRNPAWPEAPFNGLKDIFPRAKSVVCVTDDGGSTGELMKDLPLIALGDIRHVMLSSVQRRLLKRKYGLSGKQARHIAGLLHRLFNYRFNRRPQSAASMLKAANVGMYELPPRMRKGVGELIDALFSDSRLHKTLDRSHCLGNLLLAAAIYNEEKVGLAPDVVAIKSGLRSLAALLGANPDCVIPATLTPANLKVLYANGVLVTGEYKSGHAQRGTPVDRVFVEFAEAPQLDPDLLTVIGRADIIVFAPGSLFSSIIPILQVPGIAEKVRANKDALKILITNLWIQRGETDLVREDPKRRFYVSDLIAAYQRNIPGGVGGLFKQLVVLGLRDIPGSVLQRYAIEGKVPIYLDRGEVYRMGYTPIECSIFAAKMLGDRKVVQHDADSLARALRTIWAGRRQLPVAAADRLILGCPSVSSLINPQAETPALRRQRMRDRLAGLDMEAELQKKILEIIWLYKDIPHDHLDYIKGVRLVDGGRWRRCQEWDRIFSFYDPADGYIYLCRDIYDDDRFEVAFLIALGQSLLGNYAEKKEVQPITEDGEPLGKVFRLLVRRSVELNCYLDNDDIDKYLGLARMNQSIGEPRCYTRLVNGSEGFTPPGMLFSLVYVWFLDNRFAAHVEYKMMMLNSEISDLIPEQVKVSARRRDLVDFFRQRIFKNTSPIYTDKPAL